MSAGGRDLTSLHEAVAAMARVAQEGATIVVEPTSSGRRALAALGDEEAGEVVEGMARVLAVELPRAGWVRTAWARHEGLLPGPPVQLVDEATALARALVRAPKVEIVAWHVVLTRVLPGDPACTLRCDPGYDLAHVEATSVVWVEPSPEDDGFQSQRYPTTTVVPVQG